jgi:hypothetical protein
MKNNSVLDRFYNHTKRDEETGCLLWIGGLNDQGYGKFWFNNKPVRAHRWLKEFAKKFNVSAPTITNILKGRKWKYLLVEAGE